MHRIPRRLIGASLTVAALLAAAGCSDDDPAGAAGATASGESGWEFTDDMGNTVALGEVPTRIAGLNDVVASLWNYGIEPVATFGQTSAEDDVAFDGKDLGDLAILGESYGQIDLEQLAAADPDVIVTSVYPTDSEGTLDETQPLYGFESVEQQEQVAEIAPIIAIAYRGSAADVIERTVELAESLGADSEVVDAARADFEAASQTLSEAARGGVTVLPVYATVADGWWMNKAPDDPQLRLYQELGVQFVDPGGDGYFWESVGWEEVPNHPSDVILYSLRFSMTPEEIAAQPTAALLPAVRAGQLYPWKYIGMDHVAQAAYMEELAGYLTEAREVT
ncbi:ABC transporter substrate-binding protein [Geodermatophilus sabuli]|uniref:Iron complex transport system substrate-binding protein n=1 Tax=Geodermatophilus sabuli TaxID=1564158 RepID=A0A285EB51_9ACTN|nr:ABC transporter substrate-binding protein [Geodermatophilus sabuli]MBB3085267.1 iron complex transport system substrate-binding protein [Geodermatophilus sabuli]SNX95326.1 iron complex transport system substrate-binding protein [Geodermatophilus sabuli]